jgi:hypothetical protein
VHRDLKPENLMVTDQGRTKIADFGIAKATSAAQTTNLTTAGSTLGTPRYMAPERALGQQVGPRSDLYSVGVIAFELLVGRTPFYDTEEPMAVLLRQINDPIPRVDALVTDVDPALADWVAHLVVKTPEDRTPTAQAAFDDLDEILIDRLGPRWTRSAPLPARPGGATASAPTGGTRARSVRGGSAATPREAAAAGPLLDGAATVAPATVAAARPRRARRLRLLGVLGVMVALTVAAGRLLGGGPSSPTSTTHDLPPRAAERQAALSSAKTPAQRADAASALAGEYDRGAAKLAGGDPTDRTLARRMQRVADAYRKAADAVRREDGSDYDDALAEARAGERAIARLKARKRSSGVGDSQSDDPSDDAPDSGGA